MTVSSQFINVAISSHLTISSHLVIRSVSSHRTGVFRFQVNFKSIMETKVKMFAPNQFQVTSSDGVYFQSYDSIIAVKRPDGSVCLDQKYWNYSKTTSKYLAIWLNQVNSDVKRKVKSGEYRLVDLNK
jgi:hypothetical protein